LKNILFYCRKKDKVILIFLNGTTYFLFHNIVSDVKTSSMTCYIMTLRWSYSQMWKTDVAISKFVIFRNVVHNLSHTYVVCRKNINITCSIVFEQFLCSALLLVCRIKANHSSVSVYRKYILIMRKLICY